MLKAIKILLAIFLLWSLSFIWLNPVSTLMLKASVAGEPVKREWVPLKEMPKLLPALVIAAEDGQFCRHWGVDWRELYLSLTDEKGVQRGASTLSMQVTRNLFLWQGKNLWLNAPRKVLEIPLAIYLDIVYGKNRMIEIYFNIAQWGPEGEYGIAAGARAAFNKNLNDLSAQEMALLISILPNPHTRDAAEPSDLVRQKAQIILARAKNANLSCIKPA